MFFHCFYGKISEAGTYVSEVVCTDEAKQKCIVNIVWLVGSDDTIAAYAPACETFFGGTDVNVQSGVEATGGSKSDSYTYEVTGSVPGATVTIDKYGNIDAVFSKAGTYSIPIKVKHAENDSIWTSFEWNVTVSETRKVTVNVLSESGKKLDKADFSVIFTNFATNDYYYMYSTYKDYSVYLPEGVYEVIYYLGPFGNATFYRTSLTVEDKDIALDLKYPVFEVNISCDQEDYTWYNENGDYIGEGSTFYLTEGTHTLRHVEYTTPDSGTVYEATFTVGTDKTNTVSIVGKKTDKLSKTLTEGNTVSVKVGSKDRKTYSFTPTESGLYAVCLDHVSYLNDMAVLDSDLKTVSALQTTDISNSCGVSTYSFEKGKTYYIALIADLYSQTTLDLCVEKE